MPQEECVGLALRQPTDGVAHDCCINRRLAAPGNGVRVSRPAGVVNTRPTRDIVRGVDHAPGDLGFQRACAPERATPPGRPHETFLHRITRRLDLPCPGQSKPKEIGSATAVDRFDVGQ